MDELVEVDVVADVEADVHRARIGRAHMVARLGEAVAAAHRLVGIAILQQLDHHIVELHEAHVEPLLAAGEVRHADRARIDRRARASIS